MHEYEERFKNRDAIEEQAQEFVEDALRPEKVLSSLRSGEYYPDENGYHILTMDIIIDGALGQFVLPKAVEHISGVEITDDDWREDDQLQEALFFDWSFWRDFVCEEIDAKMFLKEPELEECGRFLLDFSSHSGDIMFSFVIQDEEAFKAWRGDDDEDEE